MSKQRPSVDPRVFDAAEELLNLMGKFQGFRQDIREDLKWELARRIQREWEDFCDEGKLND